MSRKLKCHESYCESFVVNFRSELLQFLWLLTFTWLCQSVQAVRNESFVPLATYITDGICSVVSRIRVIRRKLNGGSEITMWTCVMVDRLLTERRKFCLTWLYSLQLDIIDINSAFCVVVFIPIYIVRNVVLKVIRNIEIRVMSGSLITLGCFPRWEYRPRWRSGLDVRPEAGRSGVQSSAGSHLRL